MEQPDKVREPAWLTALADQRLSLLRDHVAQEAVAQVGLVMTPLTEPAEDASPEERERWERTCDNCHTFCPEGTDFYTGTCFRFLSGVRVLIAVGCCAKCAGGSR